MNTSILKADIFFVVTTFSIVLITVGILIALFYLVRVLRDLKVLSEQAKIEGGRILEDVRELRDEARNKGSLLITLISKFFTPAKASKARTTKKKEVFDIEEL